MKQWDNREWEGWCYGCYSPCGHSTRRAAQEWDLRHRITTHRHRNVGTGRLLPALGRPKG